MKYKFLYVTRSLIAFAFVFTFINIVYLNNVKAAPSLATESDYAEYLFERYGTTFGGKEKISTVVDGLGRYNASWKYLQKTRIIYGDHNLSNKVHGTLNNKYYPSQDTYRYIGVTYRGFFPYASSVIDADFATSGDVKNRAYLSWRGYCNTMANTLKPKCNLPWNEVADIAEIISKHLEPSGKSLSEAQARELYNKWLDSYDDHYARDQEKWKGVSPNWRRTSTINEWLAKDRADRRKFGHIMQPPSEVTRGRFSEWHDTPNGVLYDIFDINPTQGVDFFAKELKLNASGSNLAMDFTVQNLSSNANGVELEFPALQRYSVYLNGVPQRVDVDVADFGTKWLKNESVTLNIGNFGIGGLREGDEVKVVAEFNYDKEVEEINFLNNTKTAIYKVKAKKNEVCNLSGSGSSKVYSVWTCVAVDSEGNCIYDCVDYTRYLRHNVNLVFNESRQGLVGMWSANTNGHQKFKNTVEDAVNIDAKNEKWDIRINSHNVPGIDKLKRVIRAGRSLQMYGTIEIDMRIESFTSGTLDNSQAAFVQSLINDLYTIGFEVDSDAGKVTNNKGKDKVGAQVDSDRVRNQGKYITFTKSEEGVSSYGSSICKRIEVYDKEYNFEIPIKTKNETGKQDTSSGDFQPRLSYEVNSGIADFFTNINTRNGLHGMKFLTTLTGNRIDSGFNATKQCYSQEEGFGIQGNIYDDVRTEDVTDKVNGGNWDW